MPSQAGRALGGVAKAKKIHAEYARNPNRCRHCGAAMFPRPGQRLTHVRSKSFCSHRCRGLYWAAHGRLNPSPLQRKKTKRCPKCGRPILAARKHCRDCFDKMQFAFEFRMKAEVSRRQISGHARSKAKVEDAACEACGYSKHAEVAHIKAVSDFPSTATLAEINAPSNLLRLCPNCHWEYDAGISSFSAEEILARREDLQAAA